MIGEYAFRRDRIFKYITVQDKNVRIPNLPADEEHKLTLFMEVDDVLLHSFICDENFGYLSNPAAKDPEFEFLVPQINQPCLVYMRDNYKEFLEYLKKNQDWIDPVIYTTAMRPYADELLKILDPQRELFKTVLYQNACYIFEVKEEEILYLIKDISRFRNRDIRRSVLLDPRPVNYMMTPENSIPCSEYSAEYDTKNSDLTLL